MKKLITSSLPLLIILIAGGTASAQSNASKIEIGAQLTSLTVFNPDGYGDDTEPGFGGRIGYNFNRKIAIEAEGNFFPNKYISGEGRTVQAQFGIKVGKRSDKFGVFAKIRPGVLSVGDVYSREPGATSVINGFTYKNLRIGRKNYFTMDLGGVLELYPSARTIVRFDAGDTIIRYDPHFEYDPPPQLVKFPARVRHNFQFTTGIGFRLGKDDRDNNAGNPTRSRRAVPRFEVGLQFTSLTVNQPTQVAGACCYIFSYRPTTEPGLGGRFTFNLTDNIALEAETNFYTRKHMSVQPSGRMFQGQFGVKAGKRFSRFGFFGKLRPGFMGFTNASELTGTHVELVPVLGNAPVVVGEFRTGPTLYFSNDVGGVIEFYVSRRIMTRLDLGDTIVRYGEYAIPAFQSPRFRISRRPPETKHNFQYTAGVGFRF